jgi:hypothetical protein
MPSMRRNCYISAKWTTLQYLWAPQNSRGILRNKTHGQWNCTINEICTLSLIISRPSFNRYHLIETPIWKPWFPKQETGTKKLVVPDNLHVKRGTGPSSWFESVYWSASVYDTKREIWAFKVLDILWFKNRAVGSPITGITSGFSCMKRFPEIQTGDTRFA